MSQPVAGLRFGRAVVSDGDDRRDVDAPQRLRSAETGLVQVDDDVAFRVGAKRGGAAPEPGGPEVVQRFVQRGRVRAAEFLHRHDIALARGLRHPRGLRAAPSGAPPQDGERGETEVPHLSVHGRLSVRSVPIESRRAFAFMPPQLPVANRTAPSSTRASTVSPSRATARPAAAASSSRVRLPSASSITAATLSSLLATATLPWWVRVIVSLVRRSGACGGSLQGWSSLGRTAGRS